MNSIIKSVVGASILAAAMGSHASGDVYYSVNGGPASVLTSITDTFSGPAALSAGICSLNCTLTVEGTVWEDVTNHILVLDVTGADSSGSFLCDLVGFSGFNWTGTAAHSTLPTSSNSGQDINFTVNGVQVSSPCGNCSGSVSAVFNDGGSANNSYFEFSGNIQTCSVNGTLEADDDYSIWHP